MISISDLEADLSELETFLQTAKQSRTKDLLTREIGAVKLLIENEKKNKPSPVVEEKKVEKTESSVGISYIPVKKYSWDQEGKNVKIYIDITEFGQLDTSKIDFKTEKEGFDLKINKDEKSGWRLVVKRLNGSIDQSKCKFVLKTKNIVITLVKEKDGYWSQLPYKEPIIGNEKEKSKSKDDDPSKSLMDMMKKMYDEGDDEMKKTIAQAWTKSRDDKDKGMKPEF